MLTKASWFRLYKKLAGLVKGVLADFSGSEKDGVVPARYDSLRLDVGDDRAQKMRAGCPCGLSPTQGSVLLPGEHY